MKAVILAEVLNTRLEPYTTFLSKPIVVLEEKPILEYIIDWTRKNSNKSPYKKAYQEHIQKLGKI